MKNNLEDILVCIWELFKLFLFYFMVAAVFWSMLFPTSLDHMLPLDF